VTRESTQQALSHLKGRGSSITGGVQRNVTTTRTMVLILFSPLHTEVPQGMAKRVKKVSTIAFLWWPQKIRERRKRK